MRKILVLVVIIQVLCGSGLTSKLKQGGEDWNSVYLTDGEDRLDSFYENVGYDLVREKRVYGISAGLESIDGNLEVSGVPEINANADCAARVCDVAQCECVDNWDMFSQTCNLLEKKFCSKKL